MNAPPEQDLADLARRIVDGNAYMTLATADGAGRPWASPVWYAPGGHGELLWVSDPEARHSRNLAVRPQVGIVIFDSTVPIGGAQAVYMEALAEEVPDADLERAIGIFSRRSETQGAAAWTTAEVRSPARERLYRAVASERFVLGPGSRRLRVI
jgi:pyridoxamine 5'-phosphate oxidase-like protein